LERELRCVDIAFDSIKRAQRVYRRLHPDYRPRFSDEPASRHNAPINSIRRRIQLKALQREGLPVPFDLLDAMALEQIEARQNAGRLPIRSAAA
jgi:hypothetical protein